MRLIKSCRSMMVAAAFVALMAATAFQSTEARAQCCGFGIANNLSCAFRVILVTASGETVFPVPIGGDSFTIPDCAPFRLKVRDACGVEHYLPVNIGECITVDFGNGCCAEICKITECRWGANPTDCHPCY